MSLSTNTTYRVLLEKIGGSNPDQFVGDAGELFYNPSVPTLKLSDGSTAGGVAIGGTGGGGSIAGINTTGTSYFNNLNVTGVATIGNTVVGGATTELLVNGDARVTGILTIGTSSITLDGSTNSINVGAGITIDGATGSINATSVNVGGTVLTGAAVTYISAGSGISVNQNTGNVTISATGGGGGGESYWVSTAAGIHTLSNVGVGTTNPQTKLEIGGVLGFGAGNNVRIGDNTTGASLTSGYDNIFMGRGAGNSVTDGFWNVFFGYYAGRLTTGSNNVFVGRGSGYSNTSGELNTFLGTYAGNYNTTGNKNTFLGLQAGTYNSSGSDNVFLGSYTGISPSASRKVVLGSGYDLSNLFDTPDTTKDTQFAVGVRTDANPANYWLVGNENFNVGVGITNPTTKLEIDGVLGFGAGNSVRIGDNTTGANVPSSFGYVNIFIGASSGSSETAPNRCTYIGYEAGKNAINGNSSTFVGAGAGKNTTNIRNNFFGNYAGGYNTSGEQNTFIGGYAGGNNTIGSFNTFLGSYTGIATSSSRKILIGSGDGTSFSLFDTPDTTKDIQFAVGIRTDNNPSNYWLVGDENFNVGIGTTNPTTKLTVGGDIRAGFTTSHGVVLTSPNGTQYRLIVNNSGVLSTVAV